ARVLGAREDLADRDTRVRGVVAHHRRDVLVAGPDEIDEPAADLRLEEPDEVPVLRVDGKQALLLAQLALGAGAVFREHVGRGRVDESEDSRLAHVLDEEAGLRLGRRRERLDLVLLERRDARGPAQRDRVEWLDLQDLGKGGLGLVQPAELDERAAQPVAAFEVVGRRFDELLVQLRGAGPVGFECGRRGLIGECARAKTSVSYLWHGVFLQRVRVRPVGRSGIYELYRLRFRRRAVPLRNTTSQGYRAERQRGGQARGHRDRAAGAVPGGAVGHPLDAVRREDRALGRPRAGDRALPPSQPA